MGIRGIPANHGGFETFAQVLAVFLVQRGWTVNVYCQCEDGSRRDKDVTQWKGVNLVHFTTNRTGPIGTIEFDLKCVRHVLGVEGIDLVLGYNTAVLNLLQRLWRRTVIINMDGIEWKRQKWSLAAKTWLLFNELIGANLFSVTVTDHPEIHRHIRRRSVRHPVMIPYGSDPIYKANAPPIGLVPDRYFISVARIEPENSILEFVRAADFLPDGFQCVVVGHLDKANTYHGKVQAAAGKNVLLPGAIYDKAQLAALRFHARAYIHGHQVGGTNPSLVEALGAGNAVLAHDNIFNRWTAGENQFYFDNFKRCGEIMAYMALDDHVINRARSAARARHRIAFQWKHVLDAYAEIFESIVKGEPHSAMLQRWDTS
jgi:glycosyltransferase involved in cell wall biosynthesis